MAASASSVRVQVVSRGLGRLAGKVAIVTGGGGGLGRAQCVRLAEEGAAVAVWDIDAEAAAATADEATLMAFSEELNEIEIVGGDGGSAKAKAKKMVRFDQVDVSKEDDISTAMASVADEFGGIDILVNNHAHFIFKTVEETTNEDWDTILGVNVKGTAFTCKHVAPFMRRRGGGSIVNFGSICGVRAHTAFTPYNTTKAALTHLTTSIARDLANDGIRANIVCPGSIGPTASTAAHAEAEGKTLEEKCAELSQCHMIPRMGTEREVANAVLWLASDESSFTTAQSLFVDGGWHGKE